MDPKILIEKPNKNLSRARNKNYTIHQALDNDCSHVMFVDENIVIQPDTIQKLFIHNKDVVTALYLTITYPHFPAVFNGWFEDAKESIMYLDKDIKGLVPIIGCGLGCVLIKIEVFKKLRYPWIEGDGLELFIKALSSGFKMFCDTDTRVGHLHTSTLYPGNHGEAWYTEYRNDNCSVLAQQMIPFKVE